ncbi:MAG: branched-chain amino acid ABC transporter permease LivH [Solirubrobacterales bacterium]|nr:MAG: branched-chain amino acid ABC transporter permease LivH [Solirubrobacterales bacterium]
MVYGIIELINFAHGDIFMLGSFTAISVVGVFGINNQQTFLTDPLAVVGVLLVAFPVTMLVTGLLGVVIERVAYRPLRNAPKLAPLISAIGVSYILQNIGEDWRGPSQISFPAIFQDNIYKFAIADGSVIIRSKSILLLIVSVTLMALLTLFVQRTKLGKAMRATASDPELARNCGIATDRVIDLAWALSGTLCGLAGVILVMNVTAFTDTTGSQFLIPIIAVAVLGGIGQPYGAMLGALVIGIVSEVAAAVINPDYKDVVAFVILVIVLLVRPQGILSEIATRKEVAA